MISESILNKAIGNGYDSDVTNHKLSMMLLLLRLTEEINQDLIDYLKEYKLSTFSVKKEVNQINKRIEELGDIIAPCAPKNIENKMAFFEDYESLKTVFEKWSGLKTK